MLEIDSQDSERARNTGDASKKKKKKKKKKDQTDKVIAVIVNPIIEKVEINKEIKENSFKKMDCNNQSAINSSV
jgi:hypothetical protein